MPIVFQKTDTNYKLGIWQSTESLAELRMNCHVTEEEEIQLNSFRSENRRREWLTTRVLLEFLKTDEKKLSIRYDIHGKPILENGYSISISHTKTFVALLLTPFKLAGVDLESIHSRIRKIAPRFLNESEKNHLPPEFLTEHLHVIWGVKEVLFKIHGTGKLDFKNHLLTSPFRYSEKGQVDSQIVQQDTAINYLVQYEKFGTMMLTFAVSD